MNQPAPRFDPAARNRRNLVVALILAAIAVISYVAVQARWSGGH